MRIDWTLSARVDLQNARQYITERSPKGARRVALAILSSVRHIAETPGIGHPCRVTHTRELTIPRTPYVVVYSVVENTLVILGVVHEAKDWPKNFN